MICSNNTVKNVFRQCHRWRRRRKKKTLRFVSNRLFLCISIPYRKSWYITIQYITVMFWLIHAHSILKIYGYGIACYGDLTLGADWLQNGWLQMNFEAHPLSHTCFVPRAMVNSSSSSGFTVILCHSYIHPFACLPQKLDVISKWYLNDI